ncbi:cytochrome c6 PetJ [Spirulina sp. 06S082]|uniref:cytochrome c6 PetJ n=1 Tax=Spirulina sp. 06S082 TaxID=3110248 RepID=UPI002B1E92F9|nr:c-type cytochrome [Spirulina sp. 06S082]MEA5470954.1 c-type cytochrome [Spirulina sp. 06S082]
MKKLLFTALLLVFTATTFFLSQPAFAGDAAKGASLFSANCNACHLGGKNVINPSKTLSKTDLEKNGYDLAAIIAQVTNGKPPMPAFKGRLSDEQIEDIATYVLEKAEKGW